MLKERKEELFRALNTMLDAVTALNFGTSGIWKQKLLLQSLLIKGKRQRKGHWHLQKEKIRLPILTGRTFHITQFLSLLRLRGLDSFSSLVLLWSLQ
jgi:hypothetical protein